MNAPTDHHSARSTPSKYNRLVHWLTIAIAACTVALILMGGEVTSRDAGLSVPDWPNSLGRNMFLLPYSEWEGGIFYEHTHRLIGSLVGFLAILLAVAAWLKEPRRWVRWLAYGVLSLIVVQGVLGGLRVIWVNLDLAVVHACFAQLTFCSMALMVAATSRWWIERLRAPLTAGAQPHRRMLATVIALGALAVCLIYTQLILGAIARHYKAGLAIPDLPLAYGKWLPPTKLAELREINEWRAWRLDLPADQITVTLDQIWMHYLHRVGAVVVVLAVGLLVGHVLTRLRRERLLSRLAWTLAGLVIAQFTLGVLVVLMKRPFEITSLHVLVGAITLFTAFTILVRAIRLRWVIGTPAVLPTADHPPLPNTLGPLPA